MDRSKFDPERDLDKGPYEHRGFTNELQQRIEDSIERKSRTRWLRASAVISAVAAIAAFLLFMDWNGWSWKQAEQASTSAAAAPANDVMLENADKGPAPAQPSYSSGLLIGLRTDFQRKSANPAANTADSSYRTLFVAPLNGKLEVTAEGKGILLPYGQVFWKIDAVTLSTGSSSYSTVVAHPANKPVPGLGQQNIKGEPLQHAEKLLFVGNKYVTLEQSETVLSDKKKLQSSRVWVKELQQVNGELTLPVDDPALRSYVEFQDLFGASGKRSDQWAIVRRPGNWVPNIAVPNVVSNKESYTLIPVPQMLPDAVVSHDQLCCTWADIKRIQPDAIDALSSPKKDFIAIITPTNLFFYENRNGKIGTSPHLTVSLNENESIIMAQWSTGSYVDEWVKASRNYLKNQ